MDMRVLQQVAELLDGEKDERMKNAKQKAQNALSGLFLAVALIPFALAYIAALAGLWRFIGWCTGLW